MPRKVRWIVTRDWMTGKPVCQSGGTGVCYDQATVSIPQPGYACQSSVCIKCSVGTYGPDGRKCLPCPFGTWSPITGGGSCSTSFSYTTPGLQRVHIPFGVNKILVKLWGGGGASDKSSEPTYVSHSGGGGGFSLCNLTVTMSSNVYVLVAGGGSAGSQPTNPGGQIILFSTIDKCDTLWRWYWKSNADLESKWLAIFA